MNNYEFCAQWMTEHAPGRDVRVLDYGCGAGQIVRALRQRDFDARGCDVFYEGGDYSPLIDKDVFAEGVIRRMDGNTIPFEDASFDFVINNQVLEHVEDIEVVLAEIRRVLRPGGVVLSLFPDKGVWREGHCGVPFIHWFPKQSQPRVWYTAAFRALGFGYHKSGKSVMQWSEHACDWLDKWTHYRTRRDIHASFGRHFESLAHIEDYWFGLRIGRDKLASRLLPASLQRVITRKLGFLVLVARKPA
jgi:SAM-dependent methyltransferase